MFWIPPWHILITSLMLLHTRTDVQLLLHPPPCAFFPCLAYTSITTVTHSCIYSSCTLWNAHTPTHTNAPTCANLKIHPERLLCGIQSRCNLKASPLPQMWHQLVLSLAFPLLPLLPSSFLSSFISWAHLLTLQKVFLTCLSPLPSSTNAFFPALYREHASLSETYVLCRVNALAFASPWSW